VNASLSSAWNFLPQLRHSIVRFSGLTFRLLLAHRGQRSQNLKARRMVVKLRNSSISFCFLFMGFSSGGVVF
jgi:hypothetical protein